MDNNQFNEELQKQLDIAFKRALEHYIKDKCFNCKNVDGCNMLDHIHQLKNKNVSGGLASMEIKFNCCEIEIDQDKWFKGLN